MQSRAAYRLLRIGLGNVLGLLFLVSAGNAQTVLRDGDFASWRSVDLGPPGSSAHMEVVQTGGNPGAHIRATTNTGPLVWLLMWSEAFVWDPSVNGPLESIDFRVDFRSIDCWGQGQGIRPLLIQDGRYFLSREHEKTYRGDPPCHWTTLDEPYEHDFPVLYECDFMCVVEEQFQTDQQPIGSGPPDFGPTGGPIRFGFVISNRISDEYIQDYDNWEMVLTPASGYEPGTPFCFGDGSGTPCPCGNDNDASLDVGQAGCANGSSTGGAVLRGEGTHGSSADDLRLVAGSMPASTTALLFIGNDELASGHGTVFGDGLLCVGNGVSRLGVRSADAAGTATWGPGIATQAGFQPGDTALFQVWYRDPVGSPCGSHFNLTNAYRLCWGP